MSNIYILYHDILYANIILNYNDFNFLLVEEPNYPRSVETADYWINYAAKHNPKTFPNKKNDQWQYN